MKRKQVLKVMGMVLAGSLVLSEAAPVSAGAASAAVQSSWEQESQEEQDTVIVCYIDTKNGNDENDGTTTKTAVKTLEQAQKLYRKMKQEIQEQAVQEKTPDMEKDSGQEKSSDALSESGTEGYFVFCNMTEKELKEWIETEEEGLKKGESLLPEEAEAITEDAYQILAAEQQASPTATPVPGSVPSPDETLNSSIPIPGMTPTPENPADEETGKDSEADMSTEKPENTPITDNTPDPTLSPTPTETPDVTLTPAPEKIPENTPAETPDQEEGSDSAPDDGQTSAGDSTETDPDIPDQKEGVEDPGSDQTDEEQNSADTSEEGKTESNQEVSDGDGGSDTEEEVQNPVKENGEPESEEAPDVSADGNEAEEPIKDGSLMDGHLKEQDAVSEENLLNGSLSTEKTTVTETTTLLSSVKGSDDTKVLTGSGTPKDQKSDDAASREETEEQLSETEERLLAGTADRAPSAVKMAGDAEDFGIMMVKAPGTVIVGPDNYDKNPSSSQQGQNTQNSGDTEKADPTPTATKSPEATKKPSENNTAVSTKTPQKKTDTAVSVKNHPVQTGDTAMILPLSISTILSGMVIAMLSAFHIQSRRREKDLAWQRFREENPLNGEKNKE